jgi:hypothetical protein
VTKLESSDARKSVALANFVGFPHAHGKLPFAGSTEVIVGEISVVGQLQNPHGCEKRGDGSQVSALSGHPSRPAGYPHPQAWCPSPANRTTSQKGKYRFRKMNVWAHFESCASFLEPESTELCTTFPTDGWPGRSQSHLSSCARWRKSETQ